MTNILVKITVIKILAEMISRTRRKFILKNKSMDTISHTHSELTVFMRCSTTGHMNNLYKFGERIRPNSTSCRN